MMNIYSKLVSSKSVTNWFSYSVMVLFLLVMIGVVYDKQKDYLLQYENVSITAVTNTRDAILNSISTKSRLLNYFVSEHRGEIIQLIKNPEDGKLYSNLHESLQRHLPELFTINIIADDGTLIIDDFDNFVGQLCLNDLENLLVKNVHIKRAHPNSVLYHYDEISEITHEGKKYIFFASFSLDVIAKILSYSTPEDHQLIISSNFDTNLIEITKEGGRDKQEFRQNFRFTESELNSVISSINVPGTYWTINDMSNPKSTAQNLASLILSGGIVLLFISIIVLAMQKLLNKNYLLLNSMADKLRLRNKQITKLNLELEQLAIIDSLTGLYNRRYLDEQLLLEWNRAQRRKELINIMMIDIDHFKKFNDLYGHPAGDVCLKKVADVISSSFCRSDDFAARYGGEEFIGIVIGDKESCINVSKAIHSKLQSLQIEHNDSATKYVSVSIGIASIIPTTDTAPSEIIEQADNALYKAKQAGRNQTKFYT